MKEFFQKHKDMIYFGTLVAILLVVLANSFVGSSVDSFNSYAKSSMVESLDMAAGSMAPSISRMAAYDSPESSGEKLRKTSHLSLEVEKVDYNSAKEDIKGIAKSYDGYYTNENEYTSRYDDVDYRSYSITLKVPVDSFEAAIESVKMIAEVKSFSADLYDMTTQFKDTEAYLESYKLERTKVQSLLDRAERIEDILKIEQELSRIQRDIDNYEAQLTNINRQTDYSVISVSLSEKRDINYKIVTMTSFKQLVSNVVGSFDGLLVFISYLIGWIIPIFVLWLIWKGIKRLIN